MTFDDLRQREAASSQSRDYGRETTTWALDQLVTSTLQRLIPFYFASLFQIGRQWKVSESAVSELEKASTSENLRTSAVLTFNSLRHDELHGDRLGTLFEHGTDITAEALAMVLESSGQEHSAQLQASRRWWAEWRKEVSILRRQVDRIAEIARRESDGRLWREITTFVARGHRPSPLRASMQVAGIAFADQTEATDGSQPMAFLSAVLPLLLVALTMPGADDRSPREHMRELVYELRRVIDDINDGVKYGEARRAALERLNQKYSHGEDPFEPYLPLRKPATEELRNLIFEHTLPGNRVLSPWLDSWNRSVTYDSWSAVNVSFKDLQDKATAEAFARSADCAIKRNLPADFRLGETWEELIQRLFEWEWVFPISMRLVETNKRRSDGIWDLESFATLVDAVVGAMNAIGYRLSPISHSRLEKLWERRHGDKPWLRDEW